MDDLISRQAAKDMLWNERQRLNAFMDECAESNQPAMRYSTKIERNQVEADINILDRVPSAQPERKKGDWIRNDNGTYSCSVCQSWIPEQQHCYARYCLYCGADMRGDDE